MKRGFDFLPNLWKFKGIFFCLVLFLFWLGASWRAALGYALQEMMGYDFFIFMWVRLWVVVESDEGGGGRCCNCWPLVSKRGERESEEALLQLLLLLFRESGRAL